MFRYACGVWRFREYFLLTPLSNVRSVFRHFGTFVCYQFVQSAQSLAYTEITSEITPFLWQGPILPRFCVFLSSKCLERMQRLHLRLPSFSPVEDARDSDFCRSRCCLSLSFLLFSLSRSLCLSLLAFSLSLCRLFLSASLILVAFCLFLFRGATLLPLMIPRYWYKSVSSFFSSFSLRSSYFRAQ